MPAAPARRSLPDGADLAAAGHPGDASSYGDVIVTVTLFGEVEISLVKDDSKCCTCKAGPSGASATCGACRKSRIQPVERGGANGQCRIGEGQAYAISGKARWKMKHDAIVPATQPAIPGLDSIARVGLTFRYFRRSFLEIRRRAPAAAAAAGQRHLAGPSRTSPSPDRLDWQPLDLVDARFYNTRGECCSTITPTRRWCCVSTTQSSHCTTCPTGSAPTATRRPSRSARCPRGPSGLCTSTCGSCWSTRIAHGPVQALEKSKKFVRRARMSTWRVSSRRKAAASLSRHADTPALCTLYCSVTVRSHTSHTLFPIHGPTRLPLITPFSACFFLYYDISNRGVQLQEKTSVRVPSYLR